MMKRVLTLILALALIIMGSTAALAGPGGGGNGGGQSAAGESVGNASSGGEASNGLSQNAQNDGESTQLRIQREVQNENADQNTTAQEKLMEQTRECLQTMLKDQDQTPEDWEQIKTDLAQLKLLYQERAESREEIRNLFQLAVQRSEQLQNTQDTEQLLGDIIELDPKSSNAYRELGAIFENRGDESCHIWCNGKQLKTDVAPIIKQGRTLVPVRAISEALGAEVQWREAERTVLLSQGETTIQLQVGNRVAIVNGRPVKLDCPAENMNTRVLVPLRFIGETLKTEVQYYPAGKIISIDQ